MPASEPVLSQNAKILEVNLAIAIQIGGQSGLSFEPTPPKNPQVQEVYPPILREIARWRVEQGNTRQVNTRARSPQVEKQVRGKIRGLLHREDVTVMRPVRCQQRRS